MVLFRHPVLSDGSRALLAASFAGFVLVMCGARPAAAAVAQPELFGYRQIADANIALFPQWVRAMERHLGDSLEEGDCGERRLNRCHLAEWRALIEKVRGLPRIQQLDAVNQFANTRRYVLDLDNYGVEDYWAIPREFLGAGGDCEDYVITKFFSLRWLGYPGDSLRIVVVQDTNLRVPHAVLAVQDGGDVLILDNQVQAVLPQEDIVHYTPVYSINEEAWWLHVP